MRILKFWGVASCLLLGSAAAAQYYYSDLVGIRQVEQKQELFKKLQVRMVQGTAILPTGEKQKDYLESTILSRLGDSLHQLQSQSGSISSMHLLFSQQGLLQEQQEVRGGFNSQITYTRNEQGNPTRIVNKSSDSLSGFQQQEIHQWEYNERNIPVRMWRILQPETGLSDTTEIRFTIDSAGLVTEERSFKKGRETGFYYYYYNESRQITDIVRFNVKFNRLLPDQLFEYDDKGRLIQRMQLTGSREVTYLLFRYGYQSNGLLSEEALFDNKKQHAGSIRFQYLMQEP